MQSANKTVKLEKNNKFWLYIFGFIILPNCVKKFNLTVDEKKLPEGANLILANHVTKQDQFFISKYFYGHSIYFVVGENVFRNPFVRWFIKKTFNVIVHMRGASSLNTIKQMSKRLNMGENVCIFPEGSMTFDGRTVSSGASIAKFAKKSGANLVLCRFDGAYFAQPRWGTSIRRGQITMSDHIVSKEELKEMSVQEVENLINEKLYIDADSQQSRNKIRYIGKNLCKGLECCIYECPACNEITGLTTTSSKLICKCGFEAEYDEYGILNGNDSKQYTISSLCDNQKENLRRTVEAAVRDNKPTLLFEDQFVLKTIALNDAPKEIGPIGIEAYSDRIEYVMDGRRGRLDFDRIEGVFVVLRNTLNCIITGAESEYELQSDFSTNALKYRDLYEIIQEITK